MRPPPVFCLSDAPLSLDYAAPLFHMKHFLLPYRKAEQRCPRFTLPKAHLSPALPP